MAMPGQAHRPEQKFGTIGRRITLNGRAIIARNYLALPPDLRIDEWKRVGSELCSLSEASTWWLGDWLVYGQSRYPERYRRAIEETGLDYQTLRNYAWVARKFELPTRHELLSLQHHSEVASLPPQDREAWLCRAERFSWSRNELRRHVKASHVAESDPIGDEPQLRIWTAAEKVSRWRLAADLAGDDFANWASGALDQAADDGWFSVS
jgi:hypothetical protein